MTTNEYLRDINEIIEKLLSIKLEQYKLEIELRKVKEEKAELQFYLMQEMKKESLKSVKTEQANFAIVKRNDIKVINEQELIKDLKENDLNKFIKEKVDLIYLKPYLNKVMKETGIIFNGIEPVQSESITIKLNKEKQEQRKNFLDEQMENPLQQLEKLTINKK